MELFFLSVYILVLEPVTQNSLVNIVTVNQTNRRKEINIIVLIPVARCKLVTIICVKSNLLIHCESKMRNLHSYVDSQFTQLCWQLIYTVMLTVKCLLVLLVQYQIQPFWLSCCSSFSWWSQPTADASFLSVCTPYLPPKPLE